MKRFWLILLSLGLVMAFSVSAFAVDVKVSGEFYAAGLYLNKASVADTSSYANTSTAFYFQRLRVGTDFVVSPCLKLVTRFDAMERIWGGQRSSVPYYTSADPQSAGTRAENENIAFDLAYIDYTSPIGLFKVGYQKDYEFGTVFGDRTNGPTAGQIQYLIQKGPFIGFIGYAKETDKSLSAVTTTTATDADHDSYRLAGIYNFRHGEVGALLLVEREAGYKTNYSSGGPVPPNHTDFGYLQNVYVIDPYFKYQIGPVALQGELQYWWGDAAKWQNPLAASTYLGESNMSISALSVFLDATANLGMFYVGGSFAYVSGDNPDSTERVEGNIPGQSGGLDWNPCLIMFNTVDTAYWAGSVAGYDGSVANTEMANAWFFQARAGVKPLPNLDTMLSVSYAMADQKGSYNGNSYGWEADLTGTYKITNNLSYMLGIGYLFTGDYFKGYAGSNKVNDDYIVINKLTLSF